MPKGVDKERFEKFKKCIESLTNCTDADKTEIFIGVDYPAKDEHKDQLYFLYRLGQKELSKTVLSQCGNFMVFKMYHPDDVGIVTSLSTHVTLELKEKLKTLHPGQALCFGNSFKTPLIVQFELPNPMPVSSNIEVAKLWY